VKISDFIRNPTEFPCGPELETVEILATETLTFDMDIKAVDKQLNVMIIADRWIVNDAAQPTIDLSGSPGKNHTVSKASNGLINAPDGKDGLPGNAGGNGGNFYGIYATISSGQLLTINVNGGNGGDGQDGGDGHPGKDGRNSQTDFPATSYSSPPNSAQFDFIGPFIEVRDGVKAQLYQKNGTLGETGGGGGNGGAKGEGGHPGTVTIHSVTGSPTSADDFESDIKVARLQGSQGKEGSGGMGAIGGKSGQSYGCTRYTYSNDKIAHWRDCSVLNAPKGFDGNRGITGHNLSGQLKITHQVSDQNWEKSINEFMVYAASGTQFAKPLFAAVTTDPQIL